MTQILNELRQPVRDLREQIPAVFEAYGRVNAALLVDRALDAKSKDLIAWRSPCRSSATAAWRRTVAPGTARAPRRSPTRSVLPLS